MRREHAPALRGDGHGEEAGLDRRAEVIAPCERGLTAPRTALFPFRRESHNMERGEIAPVYDFVF